MAYNRQNYFNYNSSPIFSRLKFYSSDDYRDYFVDLINRECDDTRNEIMLNSIDSLELSRWECLDHNPEKIYNVYFLLPTGFQENKNLIKFHQEVRLSYKEPNSKLQYSFIAYGYITKTPDEIEGEQVCVQLKPQQKWQIQTEAPVDILKGYKLVFTFNEVVFERMIQTVNDYHEQLNDGNNTGHTIKRLILGKIIIPETSLSLDSTIFILPNFPPLNEAQKRALRSVKNNCLTLINGPSGTGKTLVSVHIIHDLNQKKNGKGLVCAASNIAVDNIMEMTGKMTELKILRIQSRSQEKLKTVTEHVLPELSLHRKVLERNPELEDMYNPEALVSMDLNEKDRLFQMKLLLEREIISESDMIFTTCVGAADSRLKDTKFGFCVIDEASQILEPETLIPILKTNGKVILVGNENSLLPVVYSDTASRQGLTVSMFQRLLTMKQMDKTNNISLVTLNTQYRMHPVISELYSNLNDYPNKTRIVDGVEAKDRITKAFPWPVKHHPIVFIPCPKGNENKVGLSFSNRIEASIVVKVVEKLIENGMKVEEIGVISSFQGQRTLLKKSPLKEYKIHDGIEVNSMDGFLGREKEVIILTCVRTQKLEGQGDFSSFLSNKIRMNVAITRAKRGLIVIGNPILLKTDRLWRDFLFHCKEWNFTSEESVLQMQNN